MENDNNITSQETDKNEAISNLIQSIQSKLNNEVLSSNDKENTEDKSSCTMNEENSKSNSKNSNFDLSSIIGLLGKMNNNSTNNESSGFNFDSFDPKLFSKIQQIVVNIGKKDPKKDLLISLKPFLRKSRQDKIGEYITILTIIKAFEIFNDKGSDENE